MANRLLAREEITLADGSVVAGKPVVVMSDAVLNDADGVAQLGAVEIAPAAGEQIVLRSIKDGAAALFVDEGQVAYAGAVDPAALYSNVHIPHLPVFADHATAQAAASLATGQSYAVTGGAIGVKLV